MNTATPDLIATCGGGIIFTADSIRGIREGRKTRTTRLMKPQPPEWCDRCGHTYFTPKGKISFRGIHQEHGPAEKFMPGPRYLPGKRYYCKETWGDADHYYQGHVNDCPSVVAYGTREAIRFNAEEPHEIEARDIESWNWNKMKWRSSMSMPRWAARYVIEIDDVKPIRLQEMTEEMAFEEGCDGPHATVIAGDISEVGPDSPVHDLMDRWDALNGKKAPWASNPWCFSYRFHLVQP